jgi:hypothetical protein
MSRVRSDKFTNRAATGPCTFTHGMHSTDTAGTGIGVSLGYGGIVAVGATISGNLSVGGTITYEDTTNVDSTGIVTARNGIKVGQPTGVGATFNPAGDLVVAGVTTVGTGLSMPDNAKAYFGTGGDLTIYHSGSHSFIDESGTGGLKILTGNLYIRNPSEVDMITAASGAAVEIYYNGTKKLETTSSGVEVTGDLNATGITTVAKLDTSGTLVEAFTSTTTAWSTTNDWNITNGNLFFTSGNLGGTTNTIDIYSTTGINTDLSVGQAINVTGISSVNATTAYVNAITIDGIANSVNWVGGTAPAAGGGSGFDTYTFNILKVGNATFHVIANQVLTSA